MKIAICFPSRETVHASWALDLAQLMACAMVDGHEMGIFNCEGTLICDQRTTLAKRAVDSGADYILWLDTDMRFPKDSLQRLLAHNKPIVAANYVTRYLPPAPTARDYRDDQWFKVPTYKDSTGLQQVTAAGFGVMLTATKVFKAMEYPWFHIGYAKKNDTTIGEDVYLCTQAAEKGFPTFIDHDLSHQVRHIGCVEFCHENFKLWDRAPQPVVDKAAD
jgi:GT2 family glycosyltransferase